MDKIKSELLALFQPSIAIKLGKLEIELNPTMENCLMMLQVADFAENQSQIAKDAVMQLLSETTDETLLEKEFKTIDWEGCLHIAKTIAHFFLIELKKYAEKRNSEAKFYPRDTKKASRPHGQQSFLEMFAYLMRSSKGSLTMDYLLNITPALFFQLLESFSFLIREESEEGQKINDKINATKNAASGVDKQHLARVKELLASKGIGKKTETAKKIETT